MKFIEIDEKSKIFEIVELSISRILNTKNNIGIAVQYLAKPEFPSLPAVA